MAALESAMNGYPEWRQDYTARVSVDVAQEGIDIPDFTLGMVHQKPTDRVRVVIEGEKTLVTALLGRNWLKRCEKVMAETRRDV